MAKKNLHNARSIKTVETVLSVAKKHFTELGYASVSTDALVQEAGLTRGALYHHFGSKKGLFEAVVDDLHSEIAKRILQVTSKESDPWQQLLVGCFTWLDCITDTAKQQILLIDAPAVLGWKRWLEFDAQHGTQTLTEGLTKLIEDKIIKVPSKEALVHLLNGAMNQAALWVSQSSEPQQALSNVKITLEGLLNSLKG